MFCDRLLYQLVRSGDQLACGQDAENITVTNGDGEKGNAQLKLYRPSMDLATIVIPSVSANSGQLHLP
jgi:hypothetical protein